MTEHRRMYWAQHRDFHAIGWGLPDKNLPETLSVQTYPATARPVFFGHYWLSGEPIQQASDAPCLDYSVGKEGPLVF